MKSFIHILNWLIYLAIPFGLVLFFMLVTAFSFGYKECIQSTPFVLIYTLYAISISLAYVSSVDSDDPMPMFFGKED